MDEFEHCHFLPIDRFRTALGLFFVLGLVFWLPSALIGLPVCELQIRRERQRSGA